MGGGSARVDPAGVRRMLRLRSMHRRENDQGTQQGSDPGDPNSITSSTCSSQKFLSSHCLPDPRTRDLSVQTSKTDVPSRLMGGQGRSNARFVPAPNQFTRIPTADLVSRISWGPRKWDSIANVRKPGDVC